MSAQSLRSAVVDLLEGTLIPGDEPNRNDNGIEWIVRVSAVGLVLDELSAHAERLRAALAEDQQERDQALAVRYALEDLLEVADLAPERNCSCHLSPPCNDCIEWNGLRDAIANARAVIAKSGAKS